MTRLAAGSFVGLLLAFSSTSLGAVTFVTGEGRAEWGVWYGNGGIAGDGVWFYGTSIDLPVHAAGDVVEGTQRAHARIDSDLSLDAQTGVLQLAATARLEPGYCDPYEPLLLVHSRSMVQWTFDATDSARVWMNADTNVTEVGGFILAAQIGIVNRDSNEIVYSWGNSGWPNSHEVLSSFVDLPAGTWTLNVSCWAYSYPTVRGQGTEPLSLASIDTTIRIVPAPMALAVFGVLLVASGRRTR
ncbi:hypothetical protein PHYC_00801 [Phycisphaerales bacterium]|nr:hypothetical protein PHYC_00801 [Phycisphaerales bacterium]